MPLSEKFGLRFVILATIPVFLSAIFSVYIYNDAVNYISQQENVVTNGRRTAADIRETSLRLDILARSANLYTQSEYENLIKEQKARLNTSIADYENNYGLFLPDNKRYLSDNLLVLSQLEYESFLALKQSVNDYLANPLSINLLNDISVNSDILLVILRQVSADQIESFENNAVLFYPIFSAAWLLVTLGGVAFMVYAYRSVLEPIKEVSSLANNIAEGRVEIIPKRLADGEIGGLYKSVSRMGDALTRNVRELEEMNKSKTEFISIASHQLRTPLSSMKWLIESLRKDDHFSDKQEEKLANIYESNERLISLVGDLLSISRLEAGSVASKRQPTDISELIRETMTLFEPVAKSRNVRVELSITDDIKTLSIDRALFSEAFENILDNAIAYSPEGSAVAVSVSKRNDEYLIGIRNDGPGIPEIEHDKIFNKFYRGPLAQKLRPRGSGLGLFIAKLAMEANQGKIWFESPIKDGNGVTFWLSLPVPKQD